MAPTDFDPDNPHSQQTLRALAEEAARRGGQTARRFFGTEYDVRLKDDRSEVSAADEAAQHAIVSILRAARPQDALIAEEALDLTEPPPAPTNDGLCWIIDPLDGTRNFVRHIPLYTSAVAAMLDGVPLVGAVYDPVRDVLYSASRGGGLFVNGEHTAARSAQGAARSGLSPKPVVALPSAAGSTVAELAHQWFDRFMCRNFGSTSLHLALVALGELDGMLSDTPRLWDVAPGWVLVTAMGGHVLAPNRRPLFPLDVAQYAGEPLPTIATTAAAYDRLLAAG